MTSVRCAASLTLLLLAGCASDGPTAAPATKPDARIDRCTERFVERAGSSNGSDLSDAEMRDYVRRAYCEPFDKRGWVYDDGTLSIEAFTKSGESECARAEAGGTSSTVSCELLESPGTRRMLDCALLHFVRRAEVRMYVATLRPPPACDDGTQLEQLGAG